MDEIKAGDLLRCKVNFEIAHIQLFSGFHYAVQYIDDDYFYFRGVGLKLSKSILPELFELEPVIPEHYLRGGKKWY